VVADAARLVPPRDAPALAAALVDVLTDTGQHERLVNAGTARVARYSWDTTARALAELYRALC
jgi:glycosyltransferase involved in cell wall biosynthesis